MKNTSRIHTRFITAILILTSCIAAQSVRAAGPAGAESKFLRYVEVPGGSGQLQASVVTYKNDKGVSVDLVSAVHVADASFYQDLDKSFKNYDALLYEMVKPKDMGAPEKGQDSGSWVSMLQHTTQTLLRLEFQLDSINYQAPNFVHADLDAETFFKMQEDRGESIFGLMLQSMIKQLAKGEDPDAPQPDLFTILGALRDPEGARNLKMMLAKQFQQMDDLMSGMEGPNGSVLVTERNKAAMKVLDDQIVAGKKSFGIFYGAAHLKGMEQMLIARGFKQVGEPKWRPAWDMTAPPPKPSTMPLLQPAAH